MDYLKSLDFISTKTFLITFFLVVAIIFMRYLILSGIYHFIFFRLFRKRFKKNILNSRTPRKSQLRREIKSSLYSAVIFGAVGVFILILWQLGYSQIYLDLIAFPIWYFPLSIAAFLLIQDTYYYWLHRWMHRSHWMRRFHTEHHKSLHTSVLTSFSFHPMESLFQALMLPAFILVIPISFYALMTLLALMTLSAIINHAGVEIYSQGIAPNGFRKFFIGATHHDLHHKDARKNFGLYFTFWDRWMKTEGNY